MSSGSRRAPADSTTRGRPVGLPGPSRLVDPVRVAKCRSAPETGPSIVFLSGGSALRGLSRALKRLTHNSVHMITPFDSGGSSAPLRSAFGMPSVGDLRNRLLALADEDAPAATQVRRLFGHRLPRDASPASLRSRLDALIAGSDPLMSGVPEAPRRYAQEELARFAAAMPEGFDLRGANVGNLVLTGGYLAERSLDRVLRRFHELLGVRGRVLPTLDVDLHLEARLQDGARIRGQDRITGKEHPPLASPIEELRLIENLDEDDPPSVRPEASREVVGLVRNADLICFPMGSFYSSVVCNLLGVGIGRAVRQADCPKLYIPSTGLDPELAGVDPGRAAALLLSALRADAGADAPTEVLLDGVLLDANPEAYAEPPDLSLLDDIGLAHRSTSLVNAESEIDPERLAEILVSVAREPDPTKGNDD